MKYKIELILTNDKLTLNPSQINNALDEFVRMWKGKPNVFEVFKNKKEAYAALHPTGSDLDRLRFITVDYRNTHSGAVIIGNEFHETLGKHFIVLDVDYSKFNRSGVFTPRIITNYNNLGSDGKPILKIVALDYIEDYGEE